jgi:hypothetical protein
VPVTVSRGDCLAIAKDAVASHTKIIGCSRPREIDCIGARVEDRGEVGWRCWRRRIDHRRDIINITRQTQIETAAKRSSCYDDIPVGLNGHSLRVVGPAD